MSEIVELIKSIPDVAYIEGCTDEQIAEAEKELGLKFPQEYIDYVKEFGCVDFFGHEFTGLNVIGRLNVVQATKKEKRVNEYFVDDLIVLENVGIDAIVICISIDNVVFRVCYDKIEKIADSLSGYVNDCLKKKEK